MKRAVHNMNRFFSRGVALLAATLMMATASAQTYETGALDEGFYYIVNNNDNKKYSLCPAQDPDNSSIGKWYNSNPSMPFLTTNQNVPDDYRLWHLTKDGGGNYQIIHAKDGKYVINDKTANVAEAVHLDVLPDGGTNTWYVITFANNYYNIKSTNVTNEYSFNPHSGNQNDYGTSNKGLIGYWGQTDGGSKWQFVKVLPVISEEDGSFTISFSPEITGKTIYYTTDNSDPRSSSTRRTYSSSFSLTGDDTKVKATVELHGHYSEVVIYNTVHCAKPVITNTDGVISITCATAGASIYYTTDKSTPTPSSTPFTSLTLPLNTNVEQIKAIAVKDADYSDISEVATLNINKCSTPTISVNTGNGDVTMTSTTGATIRYTTNGNNPNTGSTQYSSPNALLPEGTAIEQIKAIAYKAGMRPSDIKTYDVPRCETPVITNSDGTISITCATSGANIHYATTGDYSSYTEPFDLGSAPIVRAYASHAGYRNSLEASIAGALTEVSSTDDITDMGGGYKLAADFTIGGSIGTSENPFTGVIDGQFNTIATTSAPLVAYANGAIIRNVVIGTAGVSGTNVGVICNEATGATRIYNCGVQGGTVSGTGYVGSIVGKLDGTSRVINCYSFANVSGGSDVGGIVGYNSFASTQTDLRTMVMNCMFYGNITGGSTRYPVYGGQKITNAGATGINNYNYFRNESTLGTVAGYNCALASEDRFLTRFEFYRGILNSNRELCAYYITGGPSNTDIVAKWVLDTNIAPYPILKPWGKYFSVINREYNDVSHGDNSTYPVTYETASAADFGHTTTSTYETDKAAHDAKLATHNVGGKMGTLIVSMNCGAHGSGTHSPITLPITDMDTAHFDYCFRKVQLPYYNDYFGGNYGEYVVTGWEITSVTGETGFVYNSYSAAGASAYNFADTLCLDKDLFVTSGRVFAQGGYYYVPYGVTAISITAHWGKAYYLSDEYYDKVYSTGMAASNFAPTDLGKRFPSGKFNGQTVYTSWGSASAAITADANATVYDNALVLVGNCHQYNASATIMNPNDNKSYTIMSVDLDHDNEPDYCLMHQFGPRVAVSPIRFDFVYVLGMGMPAKVDGVTKVYNQGIYRVHGHFEITETCVTRLTEFEYQSEKRAAPIIFNGGAIEQFVSMKEANVKNSTYIQLGGNVWFKQFCNGTHGDNTYATPHIPISVNGGEYELFYLSGTFSPNVGPIADDAECYINGGRFGELAGAGQEQINGNVTFKINHALIDEFYGGGINSKKPIKGNINVTINNSTVEKYVAGPKFGNMASDKTVTTSATGTTFGNYYGAGNGGTSIYNDRTENNGTAGATYPDWLGDYVPGNYTANGIASNYETEFFAYAGGSDNCARFYVKRASFDKAQTKDVESSLTGCIVEGNYYGGGLLGAVDGSVTSTLINTVVGGNVFGAGYSASLPTVDVYDAPASTDKPVYNGNTGTYTFPAPPPYTTYTWSNTGSTSSTLNTVEGKNLIYTAETLTGLGQVSRNATLTITSEGEGKYSHIYGSVYGGGDQSAVSGNTTVNIQGSTVINENIFGGGNRGQVGGSSEVLIQD